MNALLYILGGLGALLFLLLLIVSCLPSSTVRDLLRRLRRAPDR